MLRHTSRRLLAVVAFLAASSMTAADSPRWECWGPGQPNPCRNVLNGLSIVPGSHGATVWAAGDGGTVLKGAGATWEAADTETSVRLVDIAMATAGLGWAVGDEGQLLQYNGSYWSEVRGVTSGDDQVRAVAVVPGTEPPRAWAAADWMGFGNFLEYNGSRWSESSDTYSGVLKDIEMLGSSSGWAVSSFIGHGSIYRWDGSGWGVVAEAEDPLNALAFSGPDDGWAVGDAGGISRWDGVAWVATAPFTTDYLYGVAAVAPDDVWAVGQCGALLHFDGVSWASPRSPAGCVDLQAVAFAAPDLGWIVGDGGTILRYDGDQWTVLSSPPLRTISRLALTPGTTDDLWAVGSGSSLLHWTGQRWVAVPGGSYSFQSVAMIAPDDGWAAGGYGDFFRWDGTQWTEIQEGESTTDMVITGANDGWAVGWSTIQHWDGDRWSSVTSPLDTTFQAVAAAGADQVWAAGYAAGRMAHYDGAAWSAVEVPDIGGFGGISMVAPDRGFAVGGRYGTGAALQYTGLRWAELSVGADTPKLNAVDVRQFATGLAGWMVGENGFTRRASGSVWRDEPTPTGNALLDVATISPDEAWAVGRSGVILHWGVATAPVATTSALVPATAKLSGQAGTDWRSDLVVANLGQRPASVAIEVWLRDQPNPVPIQRSLELAPLASRVAEDVLETMFALPNGSAASLVLTAEEPLAVASRTYNSTSDGTYGQSIPATAMSLVFGPGQVACVTGLVESQEARSNLGLVNTSDHEIIVQAEFFGADGSVLGATGYQVPAQGAIQRTRALRDVVAGHVDTAWVRLISPDGDFMAYGSTVDARTGDPVYRPAEAPRSEALDGVMQGLARVHGTAGTDWKSELALVNTAEASSTVTFERLIRGQANPQPETATISLGPHEVRVIEDVLAELFDMASGAVSVAVRAPGSTLISGRTFNQTAHGTYGQLIPVQPRAGSILLGSRGYLVGVAENDRFRSNLGLTNPLPSGITVSLSLVDRDGVAVGTAQDIVLSGGEVAQLDRVAELFADGWIEGAALIVEPVAGSSVDAFLSTIDNRTGDPVFQVPTVR